MKNHKKAPFYLIYPINRSCLLCVFLATYVSNIQARKRNDASRKDHETLSSMFEPDEVVRTKHGRPIVQMFL